MSLSGGKSLDWKHQHTTDELGLYNSVEGVPCDCTPGTVRELIKDGSSESGWTSTRDDLIKVQLHVGDADLLLVRDSLEPCNNVLNEFEEDRLLWLGHEGPLAERLALLTEDRVVLVLWLINLDADHHVDIALIEAVRHESGDGTERLDVDCRND